MDHELHYFKLIQKAQSRGKPAGYCERHHIIPRCLGGSNSKENLVYLTGREHFIAHMLLVKIYPTRVGLAIALTMMIGDSRRVKGSRDFEWIKGFVSKILSQHHTEYALKRWQNPEYKRTIIEKVKQQWKNPEHVKNMREKNLGKNNPNYGKTLSKDKAEEMARSCGSKPFSVYESICVRPSSKLGAGEYRKGKYVGEFINKSECERTLKVLSASIVKCLNGKSPHSGGYIFEYV